MARFDDISNAVINNGILDPLQGYDADVWALDQATGKWVLVGRFTSIELVFRNTTRPYIEMNQRVMRQLDGNFMIGWTMERGQLDSRVLQQTFGYSKISRTIRVNRHPRMQISFQINAPDLVGGSNASSNSGTFSNPNNADGKSNINDELTHHDDFTSRSTASVSILTQCKVETFTVRVEAGDEVISNVWEGVAEGYEVIDGSQIWAGHYLEDSNTDSTNASDILDDIPFSSDTNTQSRLPFGGNQR